MVGEKILQAQNIEYSPLQYTKFSVLRLIPRLVFILTYITAKKMKYASIFMFSEKL